jgi:hypothetical protein
MKEQRGIDRQSTRGLKDAIADAVKQNELNKYGIAEHVSSRLKNVAPFSCD